MGKQNRPLIHTLIILITLITFITSLAFFSFYAPLSLAQQDLDYITELYQEAFYEGEQNRTNETYTESLILDIYVDEAGKTLLVGYVEPEYVKNFSFLETSEYLFDDETNEFYAITNSLTSKQADDWTINFTTMGYYTECHIMIYLPEVTKLKTVSCSEGFDHFVYSSNESMIVDIQGFNIQDPVIVAKYRQDLQGNGYNGGIISPDSRIGRSESLIIAGVIAIMLSIVLIIVIGIMAHKKKAKTDEKTEENGNRHEDDSQEDMNPNKKNGSIKVTPEMSKVIETLSERERSIVEALLKNKGRLSQADIRFETQIPKSSLSGIIYTLEKRKIITKKKKGRTNIVELSEWFMSIEEQRK